MLVYVDKTSKSIPYLISLNEVTMHEKSKTSQEGGEGGGEE